VAHGSPDGLPPHDEKLHFDREGNQQMSKTAIWDDLKRVPPEQLKGFKRGGGFSGTAIKPMWTIHRMTEVFGACGVGWGMDKPEFQVVTASNETLVYCTVGVWFNVKDKVSAVVYGVGGDKVVAMRSSGAFTDDEAFKKAYTDALTNALKHIGAGADVHMGLWDGNKYIESEVPKSSASLKKAGSWETLKAELESDFADCHSVVSLGRLRADYREKAINQQWPKAWLEALKNEFDTFEADLEKSQTLLAGE